MADSRGCEPTSTDDHPELAHAGVHSSGLHVNGDII